MREIKFRAWADGEMHYNDFSIEYNGGEMDDMIAYTRTDGHVIICSKFDLMQYPGLKDKNGKEIDWWENDLLQSLGTDKLFGQIKYDEKCAEWRLYVGGISWCSLAAAFYDGWIKVGDIHTTPKLMKETK